MDLRAAAISCIERMPENEDTERALKHIYAIAKKAGKETRCAKKRKTHDSYLPDPREERITVMIRERMTR